VVSRSWLRHLRIPCCSLVNLHLVTPYLRPDDFCISINQETLKAIQSGDCVDHLYVSISYDILSGPRIHYFCFLGAKLGKRISRLRRYFVISISLDTILTVMHLPRNSGSKKWTKYSAVVDMLTATASCSSRFHPSRCDRARMMQVVLH
jgi:hypothetical protein